MIVFSDFHHASLLNSLIMLFEGRLGGQLYRPIGLEWAEKGFWKVYDHPYTQEQFLGIGAATVTPPAQMYPDGTRPLNIVDKVEDGIYYCQDIDSGQFNKAVTFDRFMKLPIDIIIASIPQHIAPYRQLCELHPNHPKLVFQIGNAWSVEASGAPNVMASALINNVPSNINFISYHQEFDTKVFCPTTGVPEKNIYSFMNCFDIDRLFEMDWRFFQDVEKTMPDWNFKAYGGQCRDGAANGSRELALKMQESKFIWHTKNGGDGYGHVLHNSAAVGRPLIVRRAYYYNKMGAKLMIDGETCIAIDGLGIDEVKNKIEYFSRPDLYSEMCRKVYNNFLVQVDFDKEAELIKDFLAKLI